MKQSFGTNASTHLLLKTRVLVIFCHKAGGVKQIFHLWVLSISYEIFFNCCITADCSRKRRADIRIGTRRACSQSMWTDNRQFRMTSRTLLYLIVPLKLAWISVAAGYTKACYWGRGSGRNIKHRRASFDSFESKVRIGMWNFSIFYMNATNRYGRVARIFQTASSQILGAMPWLLSAIVQRHQHHFQTSRWLQQKRTP